MDVPAGAREATPVEELWGRIDTYLRTRLRPGSLLISNTFAVPGIAPERTIPLGGRAVTVAPSARTASRATSSPRQPSRHAGADNGRERCDQEATIGREGRDIEQDTHVPYTGDEWVKVRAQLQHEGAA